MSSSQIERKLAAIMFTDIAGYTAQMSKDEAVAISLLNKKESVLKPLIAKHNGTYVKSTGDGSLSHFNSAVDAATCAKRLQESIYDDKDLNVRVGVHLGDTIFEKGDIRGDGVNIASRLESMAIEGGVFVSKEVHDQLSNQKEFEGVSLGLQSMKGVGRLIEVYGLKGDKLSEPNPNEYENDKIVVHSDDEVPSVAIIPFDNKGADEDVFYAYGISADLISDCSGAGLIRVASLKQIEELGDLTVEEKAKKLNVRYISTGTLWKMDDMFQLSIELYDTKESKVVWSDRWQENWDNLILIKGNLSDGLLKALNAKPRLDRKVETVNTEAYEYYLKGSYKYENRHNMEDTEIGRGLLLKAIELDNNLLRAKGLLGTTYYFEGDYDKALEIWTNNLKQAEELTDKYGMGVNLVGIGHYYRNKGDYDKALDYYTRSLKIDEDGLPPKSCTKC
jgi:class 3 adenylate cyclase/TolB-like protein